MKSLLAYLFLVLGLGLVFSVNASEINIKNTKWSINSKGGGYKIHFLPNGNCIIDPTLKDKKKFKKFNISQSCNWYSGGNSLNYTIKTFRKKKLTFQSEMRALISDDSNSLQGKYYYDGTGGRAGIGFHGKLIEGKLKTQIAKKEPSQTQQKETEKIFYDVSLCFHKGTNPLPATINGWASLKGQIGHYTCSEGQSAKFQEVIGYPNLNVCKTEKTINALVQIYSKNVECLNNMEKLNFDGKDFYLEKSKKIEIAKSKPKQKPENSSNDQANLEEEKRKIEEEKKKIDEEKRKIAEAKKKQEEEEKQRKEANAKLYIIGSGTGFFVSSEGHIVSNDHVVGICRKVASKIDGEIEYFNIIKTDEVNDLGIIKGKYKNPTYLSIKSDGAEYGEDVVAFGYPLADALSTSVKLTRGIVSSLSGPGNNYSEIQIDAAIQPGNSGGPVLNMEGQVVGVASSGLNKLYMLEQSEYIPENVNFAVAAPTLANFLKANGVKVNTEKFKINNTKELARIGRPATLQLFCMNTKAVFEELKQKKKHSDVLFEKVIDLR